MGVVEDHVPRETSFELRPLTQQTEKNGVSEKVATMLHENGRVNGLIGKQEEKKSKIEENVSDRAKAQTDETESMQCDISADHEEEFKFKK